MATKTYVLDRLGSVVVVKRRSNRHLRITIAMDGEIRVSIPNWAPYQAGIDFAQAKQQWINEQRPATTPLINNQPIGRAHRLVFKADAALSKPRTRIMGNQIIITHPVQLSDKDSIVQQAANKASIKALRQQATNLLIQRGHILSQTHLLPFKDIRIKQLSRRWGSCDQNKAIVLNLYLIQLPWELIDYVILHELTHTKYLNHGPDFWAKLESLSSNARSLKKSLASYRPELLKL